jgi:hypothetical protein
LKKKNRKSGTFVSPQIPGSTFRTGMNPLLIASLLTLIASRVWISFGYDVYLTDLELFHFTSTQSLDPLKIAYRDYFFPYPPLALFFTTWPIWLATSLDGYRLFFHLGMMAVEVCLVVLMIRLARGSLRLTDRQIAIALFTYAGMGFLVGHLFYDRLDLLMSLGMLACAWAFENRRKWQSSLFWNVFFLIKLLPVFWAPLTQVFESSEKPSSSRLPRWMQDGPELALRFVPSIVVLVAAIQYSDGAILHRLGDHGARSIEIYSTWSSGLNIASLVFPSYQVELFNNWGAAHIHPMSIPAVYDFLARYLGFIGLAGVFLYFWTRGYRKLQALEPDERSRWHFHMLFAVLLWLMSSQRVLSPQYFIWVMAPLALWVTGRRNWIDWALVGGVYALTWYTFDMHYFDFVRQDAMVVIAVAVRNLCLCVLCARVIHELHVRFRDLKDDPQPHPQAKKAPRATRGA